MQISRLFEMTYLLLDRGAVTARELSERFEVSPRTIYRDVDNLSAAGIPVFMTKGRNGGIRLLPEFVLDKTVLTQSEKNELLSALNGMSAVGPDGRALRKLAALFGDSGGSWLEVDFSGWGWSGELKDKFECVKNAIVNRRVLAFTYFGGAAGRAAGGEKTDRVTEPLKLVFKGQAWYLYAWCRTRGGFRFFKLSRMDGVVASGETFDRKTPEHVPEQERPIEQPDMVDVKFRAAEAIAFRIFDEYSRGCIHREPGGSLLVSAAMMRGDWLASYFLSFGQHIEILEPTQLREEVRRSLEAALEKYRD